MFYPHQINFLKFQNKTARHICSHGSPIKPLGIDLTIVIQFAYGWLYIKISAIKKET